MLYIHSFEFSPIRENTYLLYNEHKDCIIIDPGCYDEEERVLLRDFISQKQLTPRFLLNTHCHLDHVFGNKFVAETYNLVPYIHELEKPLLEYAPVSGLQYNLPFDHYTGELTFISEGDEIIIGEDVLKVLFTPGHSPGSVSFYCEKQHFVVSGDVLFQQSIGRTDLPGGDHELLVNTIRKQLFTLPDNTVVYSGHGMKTDIGSEKRLNPFLR
jgi:hydroxyacylglutathione hydrolase